MKFSGKVGNGPVNKLLNFGGDPDHGSALRHYWEIRQVINGHKFAARTDSPDGGTGKTYLGGGMHCPSASSLRCLRWNHLTANGAQHSTVYLSRQRKYSHGAYE